MNNCHHANDPRRSSPLADPQLPLDEDDDIISVIEEEVPPVINTFKTTSAISTPLPNRKPLQIAAEKRQEIPLVGLDVSPISVADTAVLDSNLLSWKLWEDRSKSRDTSTEESSRSSLPSSSSSSSKKTRNPRKRVHFKKTCTVRRTMSWRDMTPKEIRRTWLCTEEYTRMQIRDDIITDMMENGRCKKGTCTRGLESKIENTALRKLSLRLTAVEEVLVEQERQWDCYEEEADENDYFFYDFESFAYVYGPVSEDAQIQAQEVARQDRIAAEKILASPLLFGSKGAVGFLSRSRSRLTNRKSK